MSTKPEGDGSPQLFAREYTIPFVLVTVLFYLWAIPNNLNDILIKQFMTSFEITRLQAGLIQSAFYLGYFSLAMPAALLMRKFGYKAGLVTGLCLFGTGALLFWPAAIVRSYGFFLFALYVIASGLSFLETGSNTFITVLGDPRTSERRLNFSQSFNPLGAITGALGGTIFIFSGIELDPAQIAHRRAEGTLNAYLQHETLRVVEPYVVLAIVVFIMAFLILRTKFPKAIEEIQSADARDTGKLRDLLHYPHFLQGVNAQFFYVGGQVATWSFLIQYIQDYTHQPEKIAGYLLSGSLVAFAIGRFVATYLMKFFRPSKLTGIYGIINMALVALGVFFPGWVGVGALFMTSFFMSLMFPTIYALGLKGLGSNTKLGGSFMVMAIVGAAVAPPIMGLLYEIWHSMAVSFIVPLVCYAVVTHYAFWGSKSHLPQSQSPPPVPAAL